MKYECHGHIISDGADYARSMSRHQNGVDEAYVRGALAAVAASGVGFYRDGGDKYLVSVRAQQLAGEYGIDYRTPVWILHKRGYYGGMYGRAFESLADYRRLVGRAKALGADYIKLTVTGMLDFDDRGRIMGPFFDGDALRQCVDIAHGEGFRVMAHVNGGDHIRRALEAGVDSVEHGFWPDDGVVDYFLETGAVWVPTCAAVFNLIESGRYPKSVLETIHQERTALLKQAYDRGVLIASGSDCGAWLVEQGRGTLDEYAILAGLGIDPARGNAAIAARFKRA